MQASAPAAQEFRTKQLENSLGFLSITVTKPPAPASTHCTLADESDESERLKKAVDFRKA